MIDPDREIQSRKFSSFLGKYFWILTAGDSVEVDDAEKAFVFALQLHPVAQSAQVVSQMNVAGGLYAAKNSFHQLSGTNKN